MHCFVRLNSMYLLVAGWCTGFRFFFFCQILTQVVFIVTLFLCSVAYWILITDQVRGSNLQCASYRDWKRFCCHKKCNNNHFILVFPLFMVLPNIREIQKENN